jgi:hypothetical protein
MGGDPPTTSQRICTAASAGPSRRPTRNRRDRGDRTGACEHAEIALEMGTALGMTGPHGVAPRATALLG